MGIFNWSLADPYNHSNHEMELISLLQLLLKGIQLFLVKLRYRIVYDLFYECINFLGYTMSKNYISVVSQGTIRIVGIFYLIIQYNTC